MAAAGKRKSENCPPHPGRDGAMMEAELRATITVLDVMKRRGMHLDPQAAQVHEWLARMFGS